MRLQLARMSLPVGLFVAFIVLLWGASGTRLFATLVVFLIVTFIVSSYGVFNGVKRVWPEAGPGWSWQRPWLLIASAVVLAADVAYGVALYVSLLDGGD